MAELPGQRAGQTVTPRDFFYCRGGEVFLPGPTVLASTARDGKNTGKTDEIRAGMIMAQITASKKWVPCRRTATVAGGSGSGSGVGSTTVPVEDASSFVAGDEVQVTATAGDGLAAGPQDRTISSVDYANDLLVLNAAVQYNTGAVVAATVNGDLAGAEIPRGILYRTVRTLPEELYNTTHVDKECVIVVGGIVDVRYILGDYAACRDATVNHLSGILWSDRQAGVS